jgi:hypothetical protein
MDIDPIVLLAYVSVAINIITMIAAFIAYAIFHIRKRRRKNDVGAAPRRSDGPVTPVFLRRYPMAGAIAAAPPAERMAAALAETRSPPLAEFR